MSRAAIAKRVGIGQSTVGNWLAAGAYPETTRGPKARHLDSYLPYLFQRWESGCHTMVRLHQELVARGYKGSYASVREHLIRRRTFGKKNASKGARLSPAAPLSSRQATFLFLSRPEKLETEKQEMLRQLSLCHPEADLAYELVQQFAEDCYVYVQENSSTSGLKTSEPARSANSKALFWVLNETKRLWWRASRFPKTMVWLRAK
jgi:hypothetical protein